MDIRPIRSLTGEVYHYEVFLDEVRVPADRMLGREGEGFRRSSPGSTPTGSGAASTRPRRSRACCASSWSTPTPRREAEPCSRAMPACAAASPASPPRSRRSGLLFYRVGAMIETGEPVRHESALAKVMADELGQKVAASPWICSAPSLPSTEASRWAPAARDHPARLLDEPRPHHRRRHLRDPAHHRGHARASACRASADGERAAMDFRPTDGQRLLQTAARDFLARHCPLERRPASEPRPGPRRAVVEARPSSAGRDCSSRATSAAATGPSSTSCSWPRRWGASASPARSSRARSSPRRSCSARERAAQHARSSPTWRSGAGSARSPCSRTAASSSPARLDCAAEIGGALDGTKLLVADADLADDLIVAARGPRV